MAAWIALIDRGAVDAPCVFSEEEIYKRAGLVPLLVEPL